jgi:hypothetical protein
MRRQKAVLIKIFFQCIQVIINEKEIELKNCKFFDQEINECLKK